MRLLPESVTAAVEAFASLPGIGPRTAERLAFYLLRQDPSAAQRFGQAVAGLHDDIDTCDQCYNLAASKICVICDSNERDRSTVAVVEEPLDVIAIEKTGLYKGLYHVLGGAISPIDGVGPDKLMIDQLVERVRSEEISEIILATNPSTEGETTAMYVRRRLEEVPVKLTRLARGLPVGGDLEYADQITLGRALQERQNF